MLAYVFNYKTFWLVFLSYVAFRIVRAILRKYLWPQKRKFIIPKEINLEEIILPADAKVSVKDHMAFIRLKPNQPAKNKSIGVIHGNNGYIFFPDNVNIPNFDRNGRGPGYLPVDYIKPEFKTWLIENKPDVEEKYIFIRKIEDIHQTQKHWTCVPLLVSTMEDQIKRLYLHLIEQ